MLVEAAGLRVNLVHHVGGLRIVVRADERIDMLLVAALGSDDVAVVVLQRFPLGPPSTPRRVLDRDVETLELDVPLLVVAGLFLCLTRLRPLVVRRRRRLVSGLV